MDEITPDLLLAAYAQGYFPMAEHRQGKELYWFRPKKRGIIPLDNFHASRSLLRLVKKAPFEIRVDTALPEVIRGCAERKETWINDHIIELYAELGKMGHAHSIECFKEDVLVGGIYGVSLGGTFFGESMFSKLSGASSVALFHLVARLKAAGYQLFDAQYVNEHLKQFGISEIPAADYAALLAKALNTSPNPSSLFRTVSLTIS